MRFMHCMGFFKTGQHVLMQCMNCAGLAIVDTMFKLVVNGFNAVNADCEWFLI